MSRSRIGAVLVGIALALVALVWFVTGLDAPTRLPRTTGGSRIEAGSGDGTGVSDAGNPPAERVESEGRIRGRVVDPGGRPIDGARVVLYDTTRGKPVEFDTASGAASARTARDGSFSLAAGSVRTLWSLVANADGYGPASLLVRAGDDVIVRLHPFASLRGRVTDVDLQPVEGALLRWTLVVPGVVLSKEAVSDADGRYEIAVPQPRDSMVLHRSSGTSCIDVRADGFAPQRVPLEFWFQSKQHPPMVLDLVLRRGAEIRGRVIDADTRDPIADARVVLWRVMGPPHLYSGSFPRENPLHTESLAEIRTDATGRFTVRAVPTRGFQPGRMTSMERIALGADALGYERAAQILRTPEDGQTLELTQLLRPQATVTGRVVDIDGEAIAGAVVWRRDSPSDTLRWPTGYPSAEARTDDDGVYSLQVGASRKEPTRVVLVSRRGSRFGSTEVEVRAGGHHAARDLVLGLPGEGIGLVVRVEDESGRPVPGAKVVVYEPLAHVMTDDQGEAELFVKSAKPLRLRVWAMAPGYAPASPGELEFATGELRETRIVLAKGHTVRGRVLWADGSPAQGAHVTVYNGSLPLAEAKAVAGQRGAAVAYGNSVTRWDGSFDVYDLPAGPYHVEARDGTRTAVVGGVQTGATDLELIFEGTESEPESGAIHVVVVDGAAGTPVVDAVAQLGHLPIYRYAPGRFYAAAVKGGVHAVRVSAPGYADVTEEVEVRVKETREIHVSLVRGGVIRGMIENETERTIVGAALVLESRRGHVVARSTLQAAGSFVFGPVVPGHYMLRLEVPGAPVVCLAESTVLSVESDRETSLRCTAVLGGTLSVKVNVTELNNAQLEKLWLVIEGDHVRQQWRGPACLERSVNLPAGEYRVRVMVDEAPSLEEEVRVTLGKESFLKLSLRG